MSTSRLTLLGNVSEISRGGLYPDRRDRVTVAVEGAEPLYAELRLPNDKGWAVGQKVQVTIAASGGGEPADKIT